METCNVTKQKTDLKKKFHFDDTEVKHVCIFKTND